MSHLSDLEVADALGGTRTPRVEAHLAACPDCRGELAALAANVRELRGDHDRRVPREPAWMRQRAGVRRRLDEPTSGRPLVAAGAVVAAALVLAAGLATGPVARTVAPSRPEPAVASTPHAANASDAASASKPRVASADDGLLLEAESLVAGAPVPLGDGGVSGSEL